MPPVATAIRGVASPSAALAGILLVGLVGVGCGPDSARSRACGGLVVARSIEGSNELVWVRLSDGAERVIQATPDRMEAWPIYSDALGLVLFEARESRRGGRLLWLLDPLSGAEFRAADRPHETRQHWAAWDPAGRRFVYSFWDPVAKRAGLAAVDPEAGTRELLYSQAGSRSMMRASWSPTTDAVVAEKAEGASWTTWLLEAGAAPVAVAHGGARGMKPRFSRDGRSLIFARATTRGGPADVLRVDLQGGEPQHLAGAPATDDHTPAPSPTRDEVAFVSEHAGRSDVFLVDLDGRGLRNLTRTPGRREYAPRWSPDGEKLALTIPPPRTRSVRPLDVGGFLVKVIDREGRDVLEVPGAMPDWMPAWP